MSNPGWRQLIPRAPNSRAAGSFPIEAYSEFMPPPRSGWHPYSAEPPDPQLFSDEDPWGWYVGEYEEANEIQPGLEQVARQILGRIYHLLRGHSTHAIPRRILENNLYWPEELSKRAGSLTHDQGVVLMPLALSRTQDDKGRVRWTLFGVSEQGPAKAFWKSFHTGPQRGAGRGGTSIFMPSAANRIRRAGGNGGRPAEDRLSHHVAGPAPAGALEGRFPA